MNELEARAWLVSRNVPRETLLLIERFVAMVIEESGRQNLVAASTHDHMWVRHVVDSAQLHDIAPPGDWIDLGTGAGFPGMIIALLSTRSVTLVEPRARRAGFLQNCVKRLDLMSRVCVLPCRAEQVPAAAFSVISARAVAALPALFAFADHLASPDTIWLLPKGRSAAEELAQVRASWQGDFTLVDSVTDPGAAIIVASNVRPRRRA